MSIQFCTGQPTPVALASIPFMTGFVRVTDQQYFIKCREGPENYGEERTFVCFHLPDCQLHNVRANADVIAAKGVNITFMW
jgi:hypothetical protein